MAIGVFSNDVIVTVFVKLGTQGLSESVTVHFTPSIVNGMLPISSSKNLAVRPNPSKPKSGFIWFAVNQNHVWLNVAISEAFVASGEGMVVVFDGEWFVGDQQFQNHFQQSVEIAVMQMRPQLLQFFPENCGRFNRPHSGPPSMP